jgi:ribonuclease E
MVRKLFVQKQAQTVDQSRSAQNAASAIEQMVNGGAVSRGQFGQVNVASVTETVTVAASGNNAYMSQTPVAKQEARDNTERDEKNNRPNNNKKRKHKDQRERTSVNNHNNVSQIKSNNRSSS